MLVHCPVVIKSPGRGPVERVFHGFRVFPVARGPGVDGRAVIDRGRWLVRMEGLRAGTRTRRVLFIAVPGWMRRTDIVAGNLGGTVFKQPFERGGSVGDLIGGNHAVVIGIQRIEQRRRRWVVRRAGLAAVGILRVETDEGRAA